ncbi:MAG: hypothetical protein PHC61_16930 [Chitinivibrionales bacterium]|nr:hypothetical protein [Chitinivibrionales bacterium]
MIIAETGQKEAHAPHAMQVSVISLPASLISIAITGQTEEHPPQKVHLV